MEIRSKAIRPHAVANLGNEKNLCVKDPTVEFVTNLETGECLTAQKAIGSDPRILLPLRMDLSARALKNSTLAPLYVCSLCHAPVRIACSQDQQHYYFKHPVRENTCPQNRHWFENRGWIEAAKYNGAKESQAHKDMKRLILTGLKADPDFSDPEEEPIWKGSLPWERRRPDVRAIFRNELPIAFEVQLSTTFLDVIAGRRSFYLREGGLLFWIFKDFDLDAARMTEHDVFHANKCNAFIVDQETTAISVKTGSFHVRCLWAEPKKVGLSLGFKMKEDVLSFSILKHDLQEQAAFHYDYDRHAVIIKAQIEDEKQKIAREKAEDQERERRVSAIATFNKQYKLSLDREKAIPLFRGIDPSLPSDYDLNLFYKLTNFMCAMYSARDGRPRGWDYLSNDQVFHCVHDHHMEILFMYCCAFNSHGHRFQDSKEKVKARKFKVMDDLKAKGAQSKFFPNRALEPLMEALFPDAYMAYRRFCQDKGLF